ncbi:isopentenyl-diphosphate Delta-isomerase [Luedemannella flava]|uniref:Isopentenyl-diphosphate Delta-isomerase n=1 Tax=Luedemannella flava TaxID=349316 RepID=A0ABP4XM22_9ACTN
MRPVEALHAARELELVELVTPEGEAHGRATVDVAHRQPGALHRAFSVLLLTADGRTLLQRRAAGKTRFPLRWANSCCGHPAPGEPVALAAARRLAEELGISDVPLSEVGVYLYRAEDPGTDRVEHEYDHVLVGLVSAELAVAPDSAEVAELRWVAASALREEIVAAPDAYAPWLHGVLSVVLDLS